MSTALARPASRQGRVVSAQTVAMVVVITVVAIFVLYPIFYLLQAAFDVGAPDVRPPTAYGLDNFSALAKYWEIMLNTLAVTFAATIMALVFGFLTAWILTRTNVPFQRTLEQLMAVPYYVTPLLGALAWNFLGAPESGFRTRRNNNPMRGCTTRPRKKSPLATRAFSCAASSTHCP